MARLPLIALLALAAVGCGGSGDRLSQQEFAQEANSICREFEQKVDALGEPENLDDLEGFSDRAAEIFRDGSDELRALEPPEELEDDYDRLVDIIDDALEDFERLGEAAKGGDQDELARIGEEIDAKDEESDRLARELRLDDCAAD
jgi:hypothetical protein